MRANAALVQPVLLRKRTNQAVFLQRMASGAFREAHARLCRHATRASPRRCTDTVRQRPGDRVFPAPHELDCAKVRKNFASPTGRHSRRSRPHGTRSTTSTRPRTYSRTHRNQAQPIDCGTGRRRADVSGRFAARMPATLFETPGGCEASGRRCRVVERGLRTAKASSRKRQAGPDGPNGSVARRPFTKLDCAVDRRRVASMPRCQRRRSRRPPRESKWELRRCWSRSCSGRAGDAGAGGIAREAESIGMPHREERPLPRAACNPPHQGRCSVSGRLLPAARRSRPVPAIRSTDRVRRSRRRRSSLRRRRPR